MPSDEQIDNSVKENKPTSGEQSVLRDLEHMAVLVEKGVVAIDEVPTRLRSIAWSVEFPAAAEDNWRSAGDVAAQVVAAFPAYKVEPDDRDACPRCCRGWLWNVIGPDGAALGSFGDESDANEYAAHLSYAFAAGLAARG